MRKPHERLGFFADRVGFVSPGVALLAWLEQVYVFFRSKRLVAIELLKHSQRRDFFSESRKRVLTAGRELLTATQAAHEIREDLALEQMLDMIHAITTIEGDAGYLQPILESTIDGLRPAKRPRSSTRPGQS